MLEEDSDEEDEEEDDDAPGEFEFDYYFFITLMLIILSFPCLRDHKLSLYQSNHCLLGKFTSYIIRYKGLSF